jgi:hypothetical protein
MNIEEVEKKCYDFYIANSSSQTSLYSFIEEVLTAEACYMLDGEGSRQKGRYLIAKWNKEKPELTKAIQSYSAIKPERYKSREINGMDVIALAEYWKLNPQKFNILKYLLRDKGEDYEDMLKISDYALRESKLIKQRENK